MSEESSISNILSANRKVSGDGSLVIYDLTEGVNFSNPKKTAEALAKAFFENDAVNWFQVTDDHIEFSPTYKVRIVLAEDHSRKLEETVDDFLEDLKKKEIYPRFSQQIKDTSENDSNLKAAMVAGTIHSLLMKHYGKQIDKNYLQDDLFLDILERLEIRSLNNADLIDWKKLPI